MYPATEIAQYPSMYRPSVSNIVLKHAPLSIHYYEGREIAIYDQTLSGYIIGGCGESSDER